MNWLEFYKSKIFLTSSAFNNTRSLGSLQNALDAFWIFTICFLKSKGEHDIYFNFGKMLFIFAFQKVNSKHDKDSKAFKAFGRLPKEHPSLSAT